ncbi:heparinase II/III domain-containing protein [Paractinoplanes durhamensis]|uniref:Heparinase n=1 Tax=Paractinoplanes durhamensis TaxID=113563 RepID=A0ABQ3Z359_9ACTN|nr:heparinase II/III family protein [Actinoplanes durhamensis]GIE04221.1 heparinase [Actinoplanes durhamensis]
MSDLLLPPPAALPVAPATDRVVWDRARLDDATMGLLVARAETERATPWATPLASGFARYFRDGDRDAYEQVLWEREYRVNRAVVMAAVTLDPSWIDEAADGLILLCEQSTWCWPAHDDTFTRHGSVLPTVTDPYLDLGASEVAMQLTWADHLLGAQFDERVPGLRARIRYEVDRRVLTPFETRRDWHWLGLDGDVHNWNPWIHGNVLAAALRLVEDEERREALVRLIVEGLDRYVASIPPDGAIDEGYAYWWNGACRLLEAFDLLSHASRGALGDATAWPALRETVAFPHRLHLGGEWYLNHADGPARPPRSQPWDALHRAARLFGDRAAEAHAAAHRVPAGDEQQGLGRLARALTDPLWNAATPGPAAPTEDVWFPSTQVLIARGERLTLAVKGGHNGENHNHNDVGSVVVALGGVPVLVDPGRPTYTRQTFGPDRYAIWTMRSSWHNTPTIHGVQQSAGRRFAARDVEAGNGQVSLELSDAYEIEGSWRRTARLSRDVVVVSDEWALAAGSGSTVVHYVLAGSVSVGEGRAEIVALDRAGALIMSWEPAVACSVTVRELDDPMLRDVWGERLTRLDIDVSALGPDGRLDLIVKEQR